ncbi:protein of unknown function (plasmid) [Cupriavidus taiwanensis]|nr:protein of unknown function [Cupriavidus taiwanensis]
MAGVCDGANSVYNRAHDANGLPLVEQPNAGVRDWQAREALALIAAPSRRARSSSIRRCSSIFVAPAGSRHDHCLLWHGRRRRVLANPMAAHTPRPPACGM